MGTLNRQLVSLVALSTIFCGFTAMGHAHEGDGSTEPVEKLGTIQFPISCRPEVQPRFQRAVAMLHSFWYPETLKAFGEVLEADPGCAMAYWGLAMSNRPNPFVPPDQKSLARGWEAVQMGRALGTGTTREKAYLDAVAEYFRDHETIEQRTRTLNYEQAMRTLAKTYPEDDEARIFYALALTETALMNAVMTGDTTLDRQIEAGEILERLWRTHPDHPGIPHYIIHAYDDPRLARQALAAANRYGEIAPSAPHALHMPSHTYATLGMWEESIRANEASMAAAKALTLKAAPGSHDPAWLHAMDFLTFDYLQVGQDHKAAEMLEERYRVTILTAERVSVGIMLSIIPARYVIERQAWSAAANLEVTGPIGDKYPQAEAITWFTRGLGAARISDLSSARASLVRLEELKAALEKTKQTFWVAQTQMQIDAISAWIALAELRTDDALRLMRSSVETQRLAGRHPSLENRLVPMRELLGDILLQLQKYDEAAAEFERSLEEDPNRFRAYYGAAKSYRLSGNDERARYYFDRLLTLAASADTDRPELREAKMAVSHRGKVSR
ncbi:MAG: tetratricopeptide repeat protein [Burkholderiales bacterium]|nr:tetratricopeptide repeat protein [Burkholderiales bacterium]